MWFSPGLVVAAIFVWIVFEVTGSTAHWWLWIIAVAASIVIDAVLYWTTREVPKHKTRTVFTRGDK